MLDKQSDFTSIALSNEVIIISLKMSLVVGSILALINHGPAIVQGTFSQERFLQMLLTYLVPYCVSTFSSVKAIQKRINTK